MMKEYIVSYKAHLIGLPPKFHTLVLQCSSLNQLLSDLKHSVVQDGGVDIEITFMYVEDK